jgi:hypothetical protein
LRASFDAKLLIEDKNNKTICEQKPFSNALKATILGSDEKKQKRIRNPTRSHLIHFSVSQLLTLTAAR